MVCNCLGNCSGVADVYCNSCKDECAMDCSDICDGGCNEYCGTTCSKECIFTCDDACLSCGGVCSSNCSGGCYGCDSTCDSACDNACKTDSAPETISNLGINIKQGEIIKSEDFKELKTAIENELKRRNKSNLISANSNPTNIGNIVHKEHIQNIFSDIKSIDSSKTQSIDSTDIVYVKDLKEAAKSIQLFMNENLK